MTPSAHCPNEVVSAAARAAWDINSEDGLLAFLLIHTWTLATGRVLRSDVPPAQLSEEELIAFWADDHMDATATCPLPRAAQRTGLQ